MPAGRQFTLLNRKPIYVGDDTALNTVFFQGTGPGTVAPTVRNVIQQVISGQVTSRTLLALESGSLCLFDAAAGIIFTLPAPVIGLWFDFIVLVTITSNNATVQTDVGTTFVLGAPNIVVDNSATSKGFAGNGTSHVKVQMNGTTTGGIKGTSIRVRCVSATQWNVEGNILGSGAPATPFA